MSAVPEIIRDYEALKLKTHEAEQGILDYLRRLARARDKALGTREADAVTGFSVNHRMLTITPLLRDGVASSAMPFSFYFKTGAEITQYYLDIAEQAKQLVAEEEFKSRQRRVEAAVELLVSEGLLPKLGGGQLPKLRQGD